MTLLLALLMALAGGPLPAAPDSGFAHEVFGGVVPIDVVLAGSEWHGEIGGWGCTYAVIGLPVGVPLPPSPPTWQLDRFGGDWRDGPLPQSADAWRDALGACLGELPPVVADRLRSAASDQAGWWVRDEVGETVSLYSPTERVAAWVRYGD